MYLEHIKGPKGESDCEISEAYLYISWSCKTHTTTSLRMSRNIERSREIYRASR